MMRETAALRALNPHWEMVLHIHPGTLNVHATWTDDYLCWRALDAHDLALLDPATQFVCRVIVHGEPGHAYWVCRHDDEATSELELTPEQFVLVEPAVLFAIHISNAP